MRHDEKKLVQYSVQKVATDMKLSHDPENDVILTTLCHLMSTDSKLNMEAKNGR